MPYSPTMDKPSTQKPSSQHMAPFEDHTPETSEHAETPPSPPPKTTQFNLQVSAGRSCDSPIRYSASRATGSAKKLLAMFTGLSSPAPPMSFDRPQLHGYRIGKTLGKGKFGKVRTAVDKRTGEVVAIKQIDKPSAPMDLMVMRREVELMREVDHPNVVRLYKVVETDDALFLVMEQLDGGEVFDRVSKYGPYPEERAREVTRRLLEALVYLHHQGICHRDLKPNSLVKCRVPCFKTASPPCLLVASGPRAAPAHSQAQPGQLGSSPQPSELASIHPNVAELPPAIRQAREHPARLGRRRVLQDLGLRAEPLLRRRGRRGAHAHGDALSQGHGGLCGARDPAPVGLLEPSRLVEPRRGGPRRRPLSLDAGPHATPRDRGRSHSLSRARANASARPTSPSAAPPLPRLALDASRPPLLRRQVVFILLSGYEPFHGETEHEIQQKTLRRSRAGRTAGLAPPRTAPHEPAWRLASVPWPPQLASAGAQRRSVPPFTTEGNFYFHQANWGHVSGAAKDFVSSLLTSDPKHRPTAAEALEHRWLTGRARSLWERLGAFCRCQAAQMSPANALGMSALF